MSGDTDTSASLPTGLGCEDAEKTKQKLEDYTTSHTSVFRYTSKTFVSEWRETSEWMERGDCDGI